MKINNYQQGMSLVSAIFILVALSAIGIAMVTLSTTTATTSTLNIEQKRAYYAAKSGMEWAIKTISTTSLAVSSCTNISGISFTSKEGFNIIVDSCSDCSAGGGTCCATQVACTSSPRVTTIKITASKGSIGEIYHVSRTIQTTTSYDGS